MTMNRRELLSLGVFALLPQVRGGEPIPAELVGDLVAANHILATEGIVDGYGHVSVRSPRSRDRFLPLSRSIAPESVTTADIRNMVSTARAIDPKGVMRKAIHPSGIYRARPT